MEKIHEDEFHLADYWSLFVRRRWVVYIAILVSVSVALFASLLATPQYRATTTLQIERQNPDILTFRDVSPMDYAWNAYSDFYQTQYMILGSEAISRMAVERLDLVSHPSFTSDESGRNLLTWLRSLVPARSSGKEVDPGDTVTSRVLAGLEVEPVRDSHLVLINWVSSDPELSALVANAVADAYIQYNLESSFSTSDQASEFLVDQIGALKKEISTLEDQLQAYGESKRIVSVDDSNNITLKALSDIAERRTTAQTRLAETEAIFRAVRDAEPAALPEVLNSPLIAKLKADFAQYEAEISQKAELFKDDWPELQSLRSRLVQVEDRLAAETREIARQVLLTSESEYLQARKQFENLDRLLAEQENAVQNLKRDAVEYTNLSSEVQKKREALDSLIARQNEMALSTRLKDMDATSSNVRIVQRARPPMAPFQPSTKINLLLGLAIGLFAGVITAILIDFFDNTLRTPSEVEKISSLPVLATVPHHGETVSPFARVRRRAKSAAPTAVEMVTHREISASTSEAYRELRTSILLSHAGKPPGRIMVTSALPEEGKSSTAVNLAIVLAQLGRRTLLVDTDLRRPRLHKVFGVENETGITSVLSGLEDDAASLVADSGVQNLDLLTSGPIPPNPSELLNSPTFTAMGEAMLEHGYDHVVFDSPPTLSVSDPVIIANCIDSLILVVRAGKTPRQSLRHMVERFVQTGVRPIGVVVNDLRLDSHGYGYGSYRHHYHGETGGENESRERKDEAKRA